MNNINGNYTGIDLMRDFIHIRTLHQNFTLISNKDIPTCNISECSSRERYENRRLCTNENNQFKNDIHEINLQQSFDTIHCNLPN